MGKKDIIYTGFMVATTKKQTCGAIREGELGLHEKTFYC